MQGYAPTQPRDRSGETFYDVPSAVPAVKSWGVNAAVSSVITLTDNTTMLEIIAVGNPVAIKWIKSTDTQGSVIANGATANFDNVIPANWRQRFVVPIDVTAPVPSIVGLNKQGGLYNRIAWIGVTATTSVLAAEY